MPEASDEGVLAPLIGHDGAKAIVRSALRHGDVHVLLTGPPASGKSVVLMAIEDAVPGAQFHDARGFTEVELRNVLSNDPDILLLDEIDAMRRDAYEALPVPMEQGIVTKNTARESIEAEIDTQLFAACNDADEIPRHLADRFRTVPFPEYDYEEYAEVCSVLLPDEVEWVETAEQARFVARSVHEAVDTRSPRDARDAAMLAGDMERVPEIARALDDPSADVESDPVSPDEIAAVDNTDDATGSGGGTEPRDEWRSKACEHLRDVEDPTLPHRAGRYLCPGCAAEFDADPRTPITDAR